MAPMALWLLKDDRHPDRVIVDVLMPHDDGEKRIRCPRCHWRPSAFSRWCCLGSGTPEASFEGCGTVWNTFETGGRCPGCDHQWRWTSCLRCGEWSLHDDWYERDE
jgi:hypothetical protein